MPLTAEAFLHTIPLARYQALDGVAGLNINSITEKINESGNV